MKWNTLSTTGITLMALLGAFQACGGDEAAPAGSAGSSGSGASPVRDAGTPHAESDASVPDSEPELDAGTSDGNTEPDADSISLVTRQICALSGDTLTKMSFPPFEIIESFRLEPVRTLGEVVAVDPAHGEMFLRRLEGLDVFSTDANWFDAPLRPIILPPEITPSSPYVMPFGEVLRAAVDGVNDTLVVLTADAERFHISTYPRSASGVTAPIRRLSFERELPRSWTAPSMVLDLERERIIVATPPRLRTFSLMATGHVTPLEDVEMEVRGLAISPSRDELHVALSVYDSEVVTLALDAALDSPPLRSLPNYGSVFADDAHGELWTYGGVYDVEATGSAARLFTPTGLVGGLVGMLEDGDEWLIQTETNMLFSYSRETAPTSVATPLRVLAGKNASGAQDIIGVNGQRGEFFVRDQRSGFISAYPITATGVAPALRRFWRPGDLISAYMPGTAYDEAHGLIFAPQLGYDYALSVYSDTLEGFSQRGPEIADNLRTMSIAAAHDELLSMKQSLSSITFEARSTAPSDLGTLRRSYTMTSPRDSSDGGRAMGIIDMAYDASRDEVIVAVQDCIPGTPEGTGGVDEDCHFDLKIFPRTIEPDAPVETVELSFDVTSLNFDDRNDGLLIQSGNSSAWFCMRPTLSGGGGANAGASDGCIHYYNGISSRPVYCD